MPTKVHLGNHVWFCPYSAGVSDASTKPATGSFTKVGPCTSLTVTPTVDSRVIKVPNPGVNQVEDVIAISQDLTISAHIVATEKLFWQLLWQSLALTAGSSVQYNPGEGVGLVKAWIKIQQYDQSNALFNTVDLWSALTIGGGVQFGEAPIEFDLGGQVMHSTLNTGQIETLSA